jgi:hypothetical protein
MLGLNGRALPAAPQPSPQPEPEPDIDNSSDDAVDPQFVVWHEAYVAYAEAEAAEEEAQWDEQPQVPTDLE